jgi:hypothetical protein
VLTSAIVSLGCKLIAWWRTQKIQRGTRRRVAAAFGLRRRFDGAKPSRVAAPEQRLRVRAAEAPDRVPVKLRETSYVKNEVDERSK